MAQNNFWNQKYSATAHLYTDQPNEFVKNIFQTLISQGLYIIVPGDGDGRNGLWLAQQGCRVQAFDYSQVAVDKANAMAKKLRIDYQSRCLDIAHWQPAQQSADAIVIVFVHLEPSLRTQLLQSSLRALKPGGSFICQVFSTQQLGKTSGGPKDIDLLYTKNDFDLMKRYFSDFVVEHGETLLNEGPLHTGLASVLNVKGLGRTKEIL